MRVSIWRPVASLALATFLLGIAAPARVRGEDPPPEPTPVVPSASPEPPAGAVKPGVLEFRIFDVAALVAGVPQFHNEKGPFPARPDQVLDEETPLFTGESEEPMRPFGSIDDVVDRLRRVDPVALQGYGVAIATDGGHRIVAKAPAALQEKLAAALAELEHLALAVATIDVVALRGDPSSIRDGGLADAITRGALVPLAGARASGFAPGQVVARCGSDAAYVQDEDVEVAQESKVADPIVGILKDGLAFQAELAAVRGDLVTARVSAWWAATQAPRRMNIQPGGDPVERVDTEGRNVEALLDLVPGAWTVLASTGDVVFAVRATVRLHDTPVPTPGPLGSTAELPREGPLVERTFDIEDLGVRVRNSRGQEPRLAPSNYTPPEPPELQEAVPLLQPSSVADYVRSTIDPDAWMLEGSSIDANDRRLVVTANAARLDAVADRLARLRATAGKPVRLRATVVTLPLSSFPEYFAGIDDGTALLADGGQALLARSGATIVERGGVRCRPSQRNASVGGRERSYVGDYDVEVAQGSFIGNPIPHTILDGYSFDVYARPAAGGALSALELRLDRSTWLSSREVATPHGAIECPTIGIARIRGGALVPIGSRRLVGASLFGGVVTLTVVAATAD